MKVLIVVLLVVPIISTENSTSIEDVTISGEPAVTRQFPWHASLICHTKIETKFCGGSLITTKWVLTSAHCLKGLQKVEVRLGSLKSEPPYEDDSLVVTTDKVILPYGHKNQGNDIGLIDLKTNVKLSDNIQIIPLGEEAVGTGVSVTVSGWGRTSETSEISPVLKSVNLTTITNTECQNYHHNLLPESILCCNGESSRTTCSGDSGSPLVTYNDKGKAILVGIASFVSECSCTIGNPTEYTRIASFYQWIRASSNN